MITATELEVRAGARTLLAASGQALRIQPGDRIGLVGRNGAGKTTTLRILAGETEPYAGSIRRSGELGYLPQDPRTGDLEVLARDRRVRAAVLARVQAFEVIRRPHVFYTGRTAVANRSSNSATRNGRSTVGNVHDSGTHVIANPAPSSADPSALCQR